MGIKQVYTIGGNVCTLGGYAMGPTALPDPKPKTLVISTDNAACTASASAYVNGSFVTAWTARNGSASASAMVGPYQDVVVVTQTNRPEGYSSTIYSTGYTTSSPSYYVDYYGKRIATVSGTATFSGDDTATMSAKYSGGEFVVTGNQVFASAYAANPSSLNSSWEGPVYSSLGVYGALRVYNDVASGSPVSSMAYRLASGKPGASWFSTLYADRKYEVNVSAFKSLYISADASVFVSITSDGDVSAQLRQDVNFSHPTWVSLWRTSYWQSASQWQYFKLDMTGTARTSASSYGTPYVFIEAYRRASAEPRLFGGFFSGVLK